MYSRKCRPQDLTKRFDNRDISACGLCDNCNLTVSTEKHLMNLISVGSPHHHNQHELNVGFSGEDFEIEEDTTTTTTTTSTNVYPSASSSESTLSTLTASESTASCSTSNMTRAPNGMNACSSSIRSSSSTSSCVDTTTTTTTYYERSLNSQCVDRPHPMSQIETTGTTTTSSSLYPQALPLATYYPITTNEHTIHRSDPTYIPCTKIIIKVKCHKKHCTHISNFTHIPLTNILMKWCSKEHSTHISDIAYIPCRDIPIES